MNKYFKTIAISTFFSFSLFASELIPATTLKINSADGLINLKDVNAKMSVNCKYKSGLFWPESKSCGNKYFDLKVSENGEIKLPSIEKFSGLKARNKSNYDVSVSIYEGENWLTVIHAYGDAIDKFRFDDKTLQIYKIRATSLDIIKDGASIFGTELTSDIDSSMRLFLSGENKNELNEPLVTTSMESSSLWVRENRNVLQGQTALKDEKELKVDNLIYASFAPLKSEKIELFLGLYKMENYTYKLLYTTKLDLELKPEMLEDLKTLELK